jgi:lycopene beta-cyclase
VQHPDADLIIVGAGAAGLSLAARLSLDGHGRSIRTILLEPRSEYVRDRTWCFWNVIDHPFEDCVSHRWSTWRVAASSPSRRIDRSWPQLAYQHLPSDAFYAKAKGLLERNSDVELRLGVRVDHVEQTSGAGEMVEVSTDSGTLRARLVVDTRPRGGRLDASPSTGPSGRLLQHFHGQTVRVDRPVFDPGVATVMDFLDGGTTGIHFMYLLPYDDRTALVEDTWFSAEPRPVERYREEISAYLSSRYDIERYEELHAETGAIPMDPNPLPPPPSPRILDAGVRGGAARPSTGYAFLAIQRQAERLAHRLADWAQDPTRDPPPSPRYYSPRSSFLDRVFVSHIARHPERAPDLFLRMFDRVRPDSLVRFLFDGGRLADDLRVMAALPAGPLIAETIRQYGP